MSGAIRLQRVMLVIEVVCRHAVIGETHAAAHNSDAGDVDRHARVASPRGE